MHLEFSDQDAMQHVATMFLLILFADYSWFVANYSILQLIAHLEPQPNTVSQRQLHPALPKKTWQ